MSRSAILKSAGAMGLGVMFSRVLGLVRLQVFAIFFGAGSAMDAFNIAFRIPNLLRDLFAEGALNSAFVPAYVKARETEGARRAWRVARLVFTILFIFVMSLSFVGMYFAEELVDLYASSYRQVAGKFELTVSMTRIIFPFFPLVALAAAFMAVLNASGKFFLPAFASAVFNLTSILVGLALSLLLVPMGFHPIEGMAFGVVAGGLAQALCQYPSLRKLGFRWKEQNSEPPTDPPWHQDPYLRRMLSMMVPAVVGVSAVQVNILVTSILATSQQSGAVSWLNYAFRLMQFPIGIFGVSMAAVVLPRVSESWVGKDYASISELLEKSLKQTFAINLPATAGLIALSFPVVQVIFQYGSFDPTDTVATSKALVGYAFGLCFYSVVKILAPACYAMGVTRYAVAGSVLTVVISIVFSLLLIEPLGFFGLALATSLGAVFNATFLLGVTRRILTKNGQKMRILSLFSSFFKQLMLSALMGWICYLSFRGLRQYWPDLGSGYVFIRIAETGLVIVEGVIIVGLLGRLFKIPETQDVFQILQDQLRRRRR